MFNENPKKHAINNSVRLSAIQLTSVNDVDANLAAIDELLKRLVSKYPNVATHLVVLPEACLFFGGSEQQQLHIAEPIGEGKMQQSLAQFAKQYKVYLVAGTIPLLTESGDKFTASSLVYAPSGEQIGHYQKMHLFDVTVKDSTKSYQESLLTEPGNTPVTCDVAELTLGMSVCYDLRFPELFRALTTHGAKVIALPSAFTKVTGKAHWQALLQARAIENQVYIIASGQTGTHPNGRETYGHSMIINPWGEIINELDDTIGFISSQFDAQLQNQIRADIPVNIHNQFSVALKSKRNQT